MALVFVGIDPDTGGDNCPAVFIDEETGDFLLQGLDSHRPGHARGSGKVQPDRGQRVGGEAPSPDAGDSPGGG